MSPFYLFIYLDLFSQNFSSRAVHFYFQSVLSPGPLCSFGRFHMPSVTGLLWPIYIG